MKQKLIIISITSIILVIIGFVVFSNTGNATKVGKQINLGNKYLKEGKYEEAILAFKKAIEIEPKNIEARLGLSDAYIGAKKFDLAEVVLKEVIEINKSIKEPYDKLIELYKITEAESDKLWNLRKEALDNTKDDSFKDMLKTMIEAPKASIESGRYNNEVDINFTNLKEGTSIYYTLDNTSPTESSSKYTGPIHIGKGNVTLRAIAVYNKEVISKEAKFEYEIVEIKEPQASKASGEYETEQEITFTNIDKDSTVYYTLDNSEPTENSLKYTKPIYIKEGTTILRAISVSKDGIKSRERKFEYKIVKKVVVLPKEDYAEFKVWNGLKPITIEKADKEKIDRIEKLFYTKGSEYIDLEAVLNKNGQLFNVNNQIKNALAIKLPDEVEFDCMIGHVQHAYKNNDETIYECRDCFDVYYNDRTKQQHRKVKNEEGYSFLVRIDVGIPSKKQMRFKYDFIKFYLDKNYKVTHWGSDSTKYKFD